MATKPYKRFVKSHSDALVLDVGHGCIRGGCAGESAPRCVWPAAVGAGEDYDVFPLVPNSNSRYGLVKMLRKVVLNLSNTPLVELDKQAYLRALRGTFGDPRLDDRRLANAVMARPEQLGNAALVTQLGVPSAGRDCWDEFNCRNLAAVHRKTITKLDDVTLERVLKGLTCWNGVSSGMGEQENGRPLLVVESNQSSFTLREQQMEIVMEQLKFPGMYFGHGSALACYAFGVSSGAVIDVGAATTSFGVVVNDNVVAYREHFVGGDHVDALLYMLLRGSDEGTINGVLHHPSYSLSGKLRSKLGDESLAKSLVTRVWRPWLTAAHFNVQEEVRALKEAVVQASPYPLYQSAVQVGVFQSGTVPQVTEEGVEEPVGPATPLRPVGLGSPVKRVNVLPDGTPMALEGILLDVPRDVKADYKRWVLPAVLATPQEEATDQMDLDVPAAVATAQLRNVSVDNIRATAAEIIFNPGAVAAHLPVDAGGFQGIRRSFESMMVEERLRDVEAARDLVVVGGCANMQGFLERVANDFHVVTRDAAQPREPGEYRVLRPPMKLNRSAASWLGGSIVSSLSSFETHWISSEEYREHGTNICRRKGVFNFSTKGKQGQ
ncbi:actin-related protein, putative [Babesia caballi]|uniref:Actin-related protein, putative n=1 Tax=Babesia caballi TaxID=5871 RepID=A0AAV4M1H5_BABCB|nr:actin-related protein, putative [Babesia caballi]